MSWYKTGTVTVTNGSPTVTGAGGTLWVDAGTLNAGDVMSLPDGNLYEIQSINSNSGITLASNYLGGSLSGQAYAIMPIGLLPSALAQQVKSTLTTANTALASAVRFDTAAQGLTSGQQQNARTNIAALGAADVGYGRLSKSVAGGADVALTATEAANQFIETTGAQTANINVTVPASARLFMWFNNTTGAYTQTVKTAAGTGVVVPQGYRVMLECDGTNVLEPLTAHAGAMYFGGVLTLDAYSGASELRLRPGFAVNSSGGVGLSAKDHSGSANDGLGIWGHDGVSVMVAQVEQFRFLSTANANRFVIATGSQDGNPSILTSAGNLSIGVGLEVVGTGVSHAANKIGFYQSAGVGYIASWGSGATTKGAIAFVGYESDGGGNEYGRFNESGYFKASNSGTYLNAGGAYHELVTNNDAGNATLYVRNAAATAINQYGVNVTLVGDPNDATRTFFDGVGNATVRFQARSNGGLANYQANDVNLSDERLKANLSTLASPAWGIARALGDLIEEGEYSDAPGRRLLMMRAQRVEQAGLDRLVDRNVRSGLALMRGLHEQQIDMYFRKATSEVLAWADDEVRPSLADHSARLARIEQHLNLN